METQNIPQPPAIDEKLERKLRRQARSKKQAKGFLLFLLVCGAFARGSGNSAVVNYHNNFAMTSYNAIVEQWNKVAKVWDTMKTEPTVVAALAQNQLLPALTETIQRAENKTPPKVAVEFHQAFVADLRHGERATQAFVAGLGSGDEAQIDKTAAELAGVIDELEKDYKDLAAKLQHDGVEFTTPPTP